MAGFPSVKKGNKLGEKAKSPKPGIPLDREVIKDLITRCNGNLSRVADSIGTTRGAVRKRINDDVELQALLDDTRERRIDVLEDTVWQDAVEGRDTGLRCFLLKTQARHRGYDQDDNKNAAKDIATAAFDFIVNKSKNPAENGK
jgi:hypothetical protein